MFLKYVTCFTALVNTTYKSYSFFKGCLICAKDHIKLLIFTNSFNFKFLFTWWRNQGLKSLRNLPWWHSKSYSTPGLPDSKVCTFFPRFVTVRLTNKSCMYIIRVYKWYFLMYIHCKIVTTNKLINKSITSSFLFCHGENIRFLF